MNHREKPRRTRIGRLLVLYRASRQMGIRELGREVRLSAATLSRIERGHAMDADTLLKMWAWLNAEEPAALPPSSLPGRDEP
jgi:transcriptional regulator with XRE-family HTH domain